jgi:hypothetical protein
MKKVAATSGQSVSFATLFFVAEIVPEGIWAGSDMELNFYSRSSLSKSHSNFALSPRKRTRIWRIQESVLHARRKCIELQNFFAKTFRHSRSRLGKTPKKASLTN